MQEGAPTIVVLEGLATALNTAMAELIQELELIGGSKPSKHRKRAIEPKH